jgi:hypothetical protein
MTRFTRAQGIAAALCALLLLALSYETFAEPAVAELPAAASTLTIARQPLPAARALPPLAAFAAIDARPLFNPERKALPPPPPPGAGPAPPTQFSLIGVIIDSDRRLALLKSPSLAVEDSVTVGQTVDGWTVTAVEPDHVVLHAGTSDFTLGLFTKRAGGTPPPMATTSAAASGAQGTAARSVAN